MLKENNIYRGDCLELFKKMDDESVDLIIADPPYGIVMDFGNGEKWNLKDHDTWYNWMQKWLNESERVLKKDGSIFVYGIHHNIGYLQTYLYDLQLHYGRQFIWHYENNWSKYKNAPAATYEPLLWFYKGKNYTFHPLREPYKSVQRLKHKITKNGKVWIPNPEGKLSGDVWNIPVLAGKSFEKERVNHPTQKPLLICDRIIKHFSNSGDLILIPFAGSGSECVSAKKYGRKYIGMELNPKYIQIANKRIKMQKTKLD
jgi:site-specific DNA-methyltransferase (adenine-specific)